MAVKSLSRLLSSRNIRHGHKQHFCMNCLQRFQYEFSGDKHFEYCIYNETVRICMLKEGSLMKFHDGLYQFKVPFGMYADIEAILKPIKGSMPNPEMPYTEVISKHIPSCFCVYSKFAYGSVENLLKVYRNEDCVEVFCDHIANEARKLYLMFPEITKNDLILNSTPENRL